MDLPRITQPHPDMVGKNYLVIGRDAPSAVLFDSMTIAESMIEDYEVYGPIPTPEPLYSPVTQLRDELHGVYWGASKCLHDPPPKAVAKALRDILERWPEDKGDVSDGYHTFNELYAHRFALFAALCRSSAHGAWMSKLHHDKTMFEGGYFIAGIETPCGQISYHWKIDQCWNVLAEANVAVLDRAPDYDGHTAEDVVERLLDWAQS